MTSRSPRLVVAGAVFAVALGAAGVGTGDEKVEPRRFRPPRSARQAAAILSRVEPGIRADGTGRAELERFGRDQQRAYSALSGHPEWLARVLAAVPASVRAAVQANYDAGVSLRGLGGDSAAPTELPDWTIRAPKPAETLLGHYREAEAASGIPWQYFAAIHFVETRLGRIHGNSSAGAQGPMQFIPETWASYGEGDINEDRDAILAAGRYLVSRGGPDDMDSALYGYNNSDDYVAAIQAYAGVLRADPRAYDGYYQWQVVYGLADRTLVLPVGWRGG